ncbi:Peptidase, M23/M37 family [hydrothermal vent metagenome]|uniref:Peptidase, M23/M37 family n=1 Tax=hydrothermal vent metagenome TaxID=652676 RepID=A0A3B1AII2_9ZZZZ
MNYKPFLTRDFKSMNMDEQAPKKWNKLHWVVLVAAITSISTLLVFASKDASAKRSDSLTAMPATSKPITNNPVTSSAATEPKSTQITLPLSIPVSISGHPAAIAENGLTTKQTALIKPRQTAINPALPTTQKQTKVEENTSPLYVWLDEKVRRGDSLAHLFKRNKLSPQDLHKIMRLGKATRALKHIQPEQTFKFRLDEKQQLVEMVYQQNRFQSLRIERQDEGFVASTLSRVAQKRQQHISGTIQSSLFVDAKNAGMNAALIMDLVSIFGWDIDFALDLRKGDTFSLLYEEHFLDGLKIKDGDILAAQFTNQGRTYRAIRYTDPKGHSNYYTPKGLSMRKAFLRTPVDFRRISSRFGKRKHPVLNRLRLHKGVDYAASRGTPIKASGDGKVIFRGRKGGYGKAIIIRHGGRYSTLYAHLNNYRRGLYNGKFVKQGQIIGYVGSTGRATGPHLHYEFRINGVHRNPLTVKLPNAAPINKNFKTDFKQHAVKLLAQLDAFNFKIAANTYTQAF